jgi:hypothetical protein
VAGAVLASLLAAGGADERPLHPDGWGRHSIHSAKRKAVFRREVRSVHRVRARRANQKHVRHRPHNHASEGPHSATSVVYMGRNVRPIPLRHSDRYA